MISFEDVHLSFGKNEVLRGINLKIERGSKTVIIGPSGGGKSTLLRTVNRFEKPNKGRVIVNGHDLNAATGKQLNTLRQGIGMVFQSFNLYPHKTALENLTMAPLTLKRGSKDEVMSRARENLRAVGLADRADSYPSQLSGGQQQRVAIARALTMNPDILLFDEPTSALDPEMIQEVLEIMEEVAQRQNITMLFVTHEMRFAEHISDRVLFLDEGQIMEDGPPHQVFHQPKTTRMTAFLGKILH
ncbi:MAG: amino acid ABC transporter ATP-binding protein [Oscillospiraceae bacterium]|jgi:ABC-type polar amino acid transport system ATPase subunit|nr:amino acid ABC transporter ATP-binding protein [Oscillospiraceae bacterium]